MLSQTESVLLLSSTQLIEWVECPLSRKQEHVNIRTLLNQIIYKLVVVIITDEITEFRSIRKHQHKYWPRILGCVTLVPSIEQRVHHTKTSTSFGKHLVGLRSERLPIRCEINTCLHVAGHRKKADFCLRRNNFKEFSDSVTHHRISTRL